MTEQAIMKEIEELLWPYLKKAKGHNDRRQTGWGTKTLPGLVACIGRIMQEKKDQNII